MKPNLRTLHVIPEPTVRRLALVQPLPVFAARGRAQQSFLGTGPGRGQVFAGMRGLHAWSPGSMGVG